MSDAERLRRAAVLAREALHYLRNSNIPCREYQEVRPLLREIQSLTEEPEQEGAEF